MNAFHVVGGLTACWALLVSFLGITRENFPATRGAEKAVMAISILLVMGAISSAIITSALEKEEEPEAPHKGGEKAAQVIPVR